MVEAKTTNKTTKKEDDDIFMFVKFTTFVKSIQLGRSDHRLNWLRSIQRGNKNRKWQEEDVSILKTIRTIQENIKALIECDVVYPFYRM